MEDLDGRARRGEALRDLDDAAGVRGDHRIGAGGPHVGHLAGLQARGHLGLHEIVGAGRAAAPVRLL